MAKSDCPGTGLALLFVGEVFGLFVRSLMASNGQLRPGGHHFLYCFVFLVSCGLLGLMTINIIVREIPASS